MVYNLELFVLSYHPFTIVDKGERSWLCGFSRHVFFTLISAYGTFLPDLTRRYCVCFQPLFFTVAGVAFFRGFMTQPGHFYMPKMVPELPFIN